MIESLAHDLRFALRTLRRRPGAALLAAGSLALAIAGNTTVFSTINGLLYRPLPFPQAHRVLVVGERPETSRRGQRFQPTSAANLVDFAERVGAFSALGGFRPRSIGLDTGDGEAEVIPGAAVSPAFFEALGARPLAGRVFEPGEDVPGRDRVAVLAHDLWRERFGGREMVGRTLVLDGAPHDVVGVLPREFEFLDPTIDLFVPLVIDRAALSRHERDLMAVGRLRAGVAPEAAEAELRAVVAQVAAAEPEALLGRTVDALNLREEFPLSRDRRLYFLVQGALVFVLLIACANLANLELARGQARERELAIRAGLGAPRRRLARQLLVESFLLAFAAGAGGLVLSALGIRLMDHSLAAFIPRSYAPVIDARVIVFNLVTTLLGGLVFGLVPALRSSRTEPAAGLGTGAGASTEKGSRRSLSRMLVVGEIVLALVFLSGAGIMLGSFRALRSADPGFDTSDLLTFRLALPATRQGGEEELTAGVGQLAERFAALPGVSGVALANALPRTPFIKRATFAFADRPPDGAAPQAILMTVNPEYFDVLGIALREGRAFTAADRAGAAPAAVVNESLARRRGADAADAVGARLEIFDETWEIVGVVANARHGLAIDDEIAPAVYLPWAQRPGAEVHVALRTAVAASSLGPAARREIREVDPSVAASRFETLDAHVGRFLVATRIYTAVLGGFGALALLLAVLGTYGVLAFSVARRTREIGVRMALGARRRTLVGMVAAEGLRLFAWGSVLALPAIVALARLLAAILPNTVGVDPVNVASAVAALAVATFLASLVPARRAASVDPIAALRLE